MEILKYTGKYLPLKEFFYLNFYDCMKEKTQNDIQVLKKFK